MPFRRPNFFLVGGPRCGTTALTQYLRGHPNVYLTSPKEPHYFASDFNRLVGHYIRSLDDYLDLFRHCSETQLAIGEASVWYLYSSVALENIQAFDSRSRIIVMVRNPIDMAYSLHNQLVYRYQESERDFERAWDLQGERSRGTNLPRTNQVPAFLQYKAVCSLGTQLERTFRIFHPEQVKVVVFDDFITETNRVYEEVLEFLGVPALPRQTFPIVNPSREHSSRLLAWIDFRLSRLGRLERLQRCARSIKRRLSIKDRLVGLPPSWHSTLSPRKPLDPKFRASLAEEFRAEVHRLESLLHRDLSHWLD